MDQPKFEIVVSALAGNLASDKLIGSKLGSGFYLRGWYSMTSHLEQGSRRTRQANSELSSGFVSGGCWRFILESGLLKFFPLKTFQMRYFET